MFEKIKNMDPMTKSFVKVATVQSAILAAMVAVAIHNAKTKKD